ncbi:MAG: hypothetical protein K5787_03740 [Lentisphaeria bacterium]|nr:hypothetical protein [Lentisphaeria bacterium]
MSMNVEKTDCPSRELLSEFVDMEKLGLASEGHWRDVAAHVAVCTECGKIVAGYRQVDEMVGHLCEPPKGLAGRIIVACHTPGRREAIRPFPWWRKAEVWSRVAMAVAASAAVLLAGGVWLSRLSSEDTLSSPSNSALVATLSNTKAPVEEMIPREESNKVVPEANSMMITLNEAEPVVHEEPPIVQRSSELMLNGGVSTQDLRAVGSRGGGYGRSGRMMRTMQLQDNIRHVWNIDNYDLALAELHRLDATGKYQIEFDEQDPNSVRALFLGISDKELQQLVDRFSGMKWALVSPFLPQPNESKYVEFTGKKVNYLLVGVRK